MLELKRIREQKEQVLEGLRVRNYTEAQLKVIDDILEWDEKRRAAKTSLDNTLAEANRISKEIGQLIQQGKKEEAESVKSQVGKLKAESKELESILAEADKQIDELLLTVPNIPYHLVPRGKTPDDNEVFRDWTKPFPQLEANALPHWDLGKKYNLFDLELGVKLTGAGFPLYRNKGAKLQRALINFFLDQAHKAGYEEILPPLMVNAASARATGQLPDKEGQMYYVCEDELYLIPTAEVPVTNIYRDVILDPTDFPVKLTGYTPCFRREAGSYGAHVRGLNRVHQFDKVEIVRLEHPDNSYQALDEMLAHVAGLLDQLELPYRILRLCGGDMGFTSAITYDFEVYSAAQEKWLEVSSVSNFETYQTNRMRLRFRDGKETRLAHSLNGSALALARVVAAILENNQDEQGIRMPKVLHPYLGFERIDA